MGLLSRLEKAYSRYRIGRFYYCAGTDEPFRVTIICLDNDDPRHILGNNGEPKKYLYWKGKWATKEPPRLRLVEHMRF